MRSKSVFIDHREGSEAVEANVTAKYCQQGHSSCQWCIMAERRLLDFPLSWCVRRVDKKNNLSISERTELKVRHNDWHGIASCHLYGVFLREKKKNNWGAFCFCWGKRYLFICLLTLLGPCKRETRNVVPWIIFLYSIIYPVAHSIKVTIIKKSKGRNMRNNFLLGRMAL